MSGLPESSFLLLSSSGFRLPRHIVTIHGSYAELSVCADNCCDLCKFVRRELRFEARIDAKLRLLTSQDSNVSIGIRLCNHRDAFDVLNCPPWFFKIEIGLHCGVSSLSAAPCHISEYLRGRGAAPTSEQVLRMGYEWLETCCTEHKHCESRITDALKFLPPRLLDVGEPEQGSIRLVLSQGLQQPDQISYVTLSYRWGTPGAAARTMKDNFQDRLNDISVASLPRTIQDAVLVTRGLGLRYLWVDALCIILTDDETNSDWERELANMGKIYRHSVLTITASSAKSSAFGLFPRTEIACIPVHNLYLPSISNQNKGLQIKATVPDWSVVVEMSSLSERGWVLQERMSASRSLFFTEEGVFWQCNQLMSSEYGPFDGEDRSEDPTLEEMAADVKDALVAGRHDSENACVNRTVWAALVKRFTRKALTVPTDRLPALAGLAADIARLSGAQYSLGVFTHNLRHELAWYVPQLRDSVEDTPARLPGVPSWSWASLNRPIEFHTLKIRRPKIEMQGLVTKLTIHGQQVRFRACLGRMLRPSEDGDTKIICPRGRILSSVCRRYTLRRSERETIASSIASTRTATTRPPEYCIWYDTSPEDPFRDGEPLVCLQWTKWTRLRRSTDGKTDWTQRWTGALIVAPVSTEECTYRRIGWMEIESEEVFWEEPSDIILI